MEKILYLIEMDKSCGEKSYGEKATVKRAAMIGKQHEKHRKPNRVRAKPLMEDFKENLILREETSSPHDKRAKKHARFEISTMIDMIHRSAKFYDIIR